MGRSRTVRALATGVVVLAATRCLHKPANHSFVPGPLRRNAAPAAAAASAATMLAPAAFADEIGDAAKKLGDSSYAFAKEVDWNNGIFLQAPGKFQPLEALKAIDKMIVMGVQADPKLLKAAADAHHKAIGSISGPNGVTSRADWDSVNAALGRVIASVPEATVMDVYNSVSGITDPAVPAYMKSLVNGADAEKAYEGFLAFKDVVKRSQVSTAAAPPTVSASGDAIGEAAKKLSEQSYPFLKDINWLSDIYLKPLPDATISKKAIAIDKMIMMGAKADGNLLKAAAQAHHQAIGSIDANGVTSLADYSAVNAALGRVVASVPKKMVMDVYNSMASLVAPTVPNNMFASVNPLDANAAAKAFYTFKDVVQAASQVA
uniref:Peridinin-chlorophyll a-binding protein PCP n=1 Tax=Lingulaulax polyedra TaxID=160621 RepID=O00941_LINPO|nr:peridinin-chlorophyll a-binding protein PCP precursor [Lingulodinium polyedra]